MINRREHRYRILLCSISLAFGGEQKQIAQILQHLDRERFEVILCCIKPLKYIDEAIRKSGVPLLSLGIQNHRNLPRVVWGLRPVIKQYNIDLIHVGIIGSEYQGLIAAISTGKPAVAILQSTFELTARAQSLGSTGIAWRCKWRILYTIHAILARIAKVHYVAISDAIKQSAVRELHLPVNHVTVIPIGVTPEVYDRRTCPEGVVAKLRSELCLDGAYPVLLNVARLSSPKGQAELLQAMSCIRRRLPGARLLIAGDGPLLPELEKLRDQLNLRTEVLLLGRRDDINTLLHISDLFVFSSYFEGLPGAVVEAMAARKPTVAFDIPALREVVRDGHSGVLIEGRNVRRFAEIIIDLAEHSDITRNMGERAQQIVKEKFDIRQNIKSLEAIYQKMLEGS